MQPWRSVLLLGLFWSVSEGTPASVAWCCLSTGGVQPSAFCTVLCWRVLALECGQCPKGTGQGGLFAIGISRSVFLHVLDSWPIRCRLAQVPR